MTEPNLEDKIRALDRFKGECDPDQPLLGSVLVRISDVKELIANQVREAELNTIRVMISKVNFMCDQTVVSEYADDRIAELKGK